MDGTMISSIVPAVGLGTRSAVSPASLTLLAIGVLLALLVARELSSAALSRGKVLDRVFVVAIVPLAIMFALLAVARLSGF